MSVRMEGGRPRFDLENAPRDGLRAVMRTYIGVNQREKLRSHTKTVSMLWSIMWKPGTHSGPKGGVAC